MQKKSRINIFSKAFKKKPAGIKNEWKIKIYFLGLIEGFFDEIEVGGWGPIVTSTLIASNYNIKTTIGTVNIAEFFVTLTESFVFLILMRDSFFEYGSCILGLIIGGVIISLTAVILPRFQALPLIKIGDTVATATYMGADVDWYIKADDIILKNWK